MVGLGTAATVVTAVRGEPRAIPVALGFFTVMEALQVGGYWVIDDCQLTANRNVTVLSYLHITLQPLFINAFAMATAPTAVSKPMKHWAYALAALATMSMLMRLVSFNWTSQCPLGDPLCGPAFCTVSGTAIMMTSGRTKLSNRIAMTRKTITSATTRLIWIAAHVWLN